LSLAQPVTSLLRVDLQHEVATYLVRVPSYVTRYIVTLVTSHLDVTAISTLVTELVRSYYLPDGRLYTVVRVPTRLLEKVDYVTSLRGVSSEIRTMSEEEYQRLLQRLKREAARPQPVPAPRELVELGRGGALVVK